MLRLTESAQGLIISYPAWLALLSVAGIALLVYAFRKSGLKRRWAVVVVSMLMMWAGLYFFTFKVELTAASGSVYNLFREEQSMDWKDATAAAVVTRNKGKSGPKQFMSVVDGSLRELEIPLGGLGDAERQRVIAFVYSKMPR